MPAESSALRILLTKPVVGLIPCVEAIFTEISDWTSSQAHIGHQQGFFQLLEGDWDTEVKDVQNERDIVMDRMYLGLALQVDPETPANQFFDMQLQATDYRESLVRLLKHWRRCPKDDQMARILVPMRKEEERITPTSRFKTDNQGFTLMGIGAEFTLKYRVEYKRSYPNPVP